MEIQDAEDTAYLPTAKSSVKLVKNSRGINWDIKCVKGEEHLLEGIMQEAIKIHKLLTEEKLT